MWLDQTDIHVGDRWREEIQQALIRCTELIVVLSPDSVISDDVLNETAFALDKGKAVIPLLQRECNIPYWLIRFQYVDFRSDYTSALRYLVVNLAAKAHLNAPNAPAAPSRQPSRPGTTNPAEFYIPDWREREKAETAQKAEPDRRVAEARREFEKYLVARQKSDVRSVAAKPLRHLFGRLKQLLESRRQTTHAKSAPDAVSLGQRVAAALCYFPLTPLCGPALIGAIAAYKYKNDRFIGFNALQSMYLFAAAFAVFFLMLFVLIGLAMALSINGSNEFDTFSRPFLEILLAGYLVLSIFMMFKSFKGQRVKLPVIGSLAEKQANQVQKTR